MAENKIKSALEAEKQHSLVVEAIIENCENGQVGQTTTSKSRRLNCFFENEPLGFEKDPLNSLQKNTSPRSIRRSQLGR